MNPVHTPKGTIVNALMSLVKNAIFFTGLLFSILLMGKRGPAIRKAAFGRKPLCSHAYHSNGSSY